MHGFRKILCTIESEKNWDFLARRKGKVNIAHGLEARLESGHPVGVGVCLSDLQGQPVRQVGEVTGHQWH